MMHWYLNEQREQIMNVAREFAQNECRPVALEVDRKDRQPVELFKRAAELGFVGMTWPEEYGGLGLDNISYCLMYEEIAKELPVLNTLIGGTSTLCGRHILDSGDPEQAKSILFLQQKVIPSCQRETASRWDCATTRNSRQGRFGTVMNGL